MVVGSNSLSTKILKLKLISRATLRISSSVVLLRNNMAAAAAQPKQERHFLSRELDLNVPNGRTRQIFDEGALNYKQEKQVEDAINVLIEIRQKGGPEKPVSPDQLPRGNKDAKLQQKHAQARAEYISKLKEWQSYRSEEYKLLHNTAELIIILEKIKKILTRPVEAKEQKNKEKEKKSREQREAKDKRTLEELLNRLDDKAPENAQRKKPFVPKGFKARVRGVNLRDPKSIQTRIDELKNEDKRVQRVLEVYAVRKTKFRISTSSTVALSATLQKVVEDIAEHACRMGTQRGKHLIKSDHLLIGGRYKELPTYPLWAELPHVKHLEAREERRAAYESKVKEARRRAMLKHNRVIEELKRAHEGQKEALKEALKEHKFVFKPKSFEDHEAEHGYARKEERKDEDGNPKKVKRAEGVMVQSYSYSWLNIDYEELASDNINSFIGPVGDICDAAVEIIVDEGAADKDSIRISAGLKHFLNKVCLDLIYATAVQVELYLKVSKSKTVTPEMVRAAICGRMLHGQATPHGQYNMTSEQNEIFRYIDDKVAACEKQIQTTANIRKAKLEVDDIAQPKVKEVPASPAEEEEEEEGEEEGDEEDNGDGEGFEEDALGEMDDEPVAKPVVKAKAPAKAPAAPAPKAKAGAKK